MGANIPGKLMRFLVCLGGGPKFKRLVEDVAMKGYEGFNPGHAPNPKPG